jgi:hypothetical protein
MKSGFKKESRGFKKESDEFRSGFKKENGEFINESYGFSTYYYSENTRFEFFYERLGNELYGEYTVENRRYNLFSLLSFIEKNGENNLSIFAEDLNKKPFEKSQGEADNLSVFPTSERYLKESLSYYACLLMENIDGFASFSDGLERIIIEYEGFLRSVLNKKNDGLCDIAIAEAIKAGDYNKALFYIDKKVDKTENDRKKEAILKNKI